MDKLQELPKKLLEWWNKFAPKQKTIIICVAAGVVLMFTILVSAIAKPKYVVLQTCENAKEASEIVEILDSSNIKYDTSNDGLQISVQEKDESTAILVLGAKNIPTQSASIDDVVEGSFSMTEADKQKKYKEFQERKMEKVLETNDLVDRAQVQFYIPTDDGTLIAKTVPSSAAVVLELNGEMSQEAALALATVIKTALGNETLENISIIDTNSNLLFSGDDDVSIAGNASNQFTVKQQAETRVKQEVRNVLIGTNQYDNVEVSSNLDIDFSTSSEVDKKYTPAEGSDQGVFKSQRKHDSTTTGITGGEPGTGSNNNDDTTYVIPEYANSTSEVSESETDYLPNENITQNNKPPGTVNYTNSSVSVAATKLKVYKEEEVSAQGLLDGTTWEAFQAANSADVAMPVDEEMYEVVANATGIGMDKITIVAYEKAIFLDKEGLPIKASDVVQVILILIILGLLAFVVLRSMRGEKSEDAEEELSVEALLQSTPQMDLENIELEDKSETRKLIERFVEENPEAVANLLRNWLTEDWG